VRGVRCLEILVCERVEKLGIAVEKMCIKGGEVLGLPLIYAQKSGESCG
jgi:hypothetical protein